MMSSYSFTPEQQTAMRRDNTRVVRAHLAWFDGAAGVALWYPPLRRRYENLATAQREFEEGLDTDVSVSWMEQEAALIQDEGRKILLWGVPLALLLVSGLGYGIYRKMQR